MAPKIQNMMSDTQRTDDVSKPVDDQVINQVTFHGDKLTG